MIRIGNRVTEKDVRDHLNRCGYHGNTATILQLELVAIERPGWMQVFSFQRRRDARARRPAAAVRRRRR